MSIYQGRSLLSYALEDIVEGESEPLAIDQLKETREEAQETGEYDLLQEKVKELVEEKKEVNMSEAVEEPPSDEPTDADSEPSDTSEETPEEQPAEESDSDSQENDSSEESETTEQSADESENDTPVEENQKELNGKRQSVATESLRNDAYYSRSALTVISSEDISSTVTATGAALMTAAGSVINAATLAGTVVINFATVLAHLGIKYTPSVINAIKRSTAYLFTKTAKITLKLIVKSTEFIKSHTRSSRKLKSDIEKVRKIIQQLKESSEGKAIELTKVQSGDEKLASWMTVSGKTDAMNAAGIMRKFANDITHEIDQRVSYDLDVVKKLITMSERNLSGSFIRTLNVSPFSGGFLKKNINWDQADSELIDAYLYQDRLPDGVLLIANLPKQNLGEIDKVSAAYRESSMFLTTDGKYEGPAEKVDYMDIEGVSNFLDVLEGICDDAGKHRSLYLKIQKQSEGLKFGYRHYYQKLVQGGREKQTLEELMEYVHLKQNFVAGVYVPAAMDIHDFVTSFVIRGIRFAKENVAQLRVQQGESAV